MDKPLEFSAANSTAIFQRKLNTIIDILVHENILVENYIDCIFVYMEAFEVDRVFERLVQLIQQLGLHINEDKVVQPAHKLICMGI